MDFHKPTADEFEALHARLCALEKPGADYGFYSMLFWQCYYGRIGEVCGCLTQINEYRKKLICLAPTQDGDFAAAIAALHTLAQARGLTLCLRGVTQDVKQVLEAAFPNRFSFRLNRNAADYIYTVQELSQLRGRKLQQKRNHCNHFCEQNPDWHTETLTQSNAHLCSEMAQAWYALHEPSEALECEKGAIALALANFQRLKMDGLLLFAGQKVVAFSLGGRLNAQYYDVCFEKAFAEIEGAYAIINREFSRMVAEKYPQISFLNREDDMGLAGLRMAKLSYKPTLLLEKYEALWEDEA